MKLFIIFYIFIPLVYSELHTFMAAAYTGQRFPGTPEFSAETRLDGQQIDYYDSNKKKLILKQDWMKEFASTEQWKEYTEIREKLQQIYRNNSHVLMDTFTQSQGVHTYQRIYGCDWDDETGDSLGFDRHAYDGEDFISLDLKENRYNASVKRALLTAMKWNNDREQLENIKQYFEHECVYWLKEFLYLSKDTFKKADPEVSLLQKNLEDYVECHVTGFLFRNTRILWRKNGQALSDSSNLVESGDTLPNEDGTFQKTATLYVLPNKWKKDQYSCVVEHKSLTETIQKILTEDQIKRNKSASDASYIIYLVIISVIVLLIGLFVLWKPWNKLKRCYEKISDEKSSTLSEQGPSQALVSTPSTERSFPPEDSDLSVSGSLLFPHRD